MRSFLVTVFLLALCGAAIPAHAKKTEGEVPDPAALSRVKTYCIDTSQMSPSEAADVQKFVGEQNSPKKLLGKLSWSLADNCSQVDAVITLKFEPTSIMDSTGAPGAMQASTSSSNAIPGSGVNAGANAYDTALTVSDRSGKLLYRVTGEAAPLHPERSLKSPFTMLVSDLKKVSP
jgi:hypothetical protein